MKKQYRGGWAPRYFSRGACDNMNLRPPPPPPSPPPPPPHPAVVSSNIDSGEANDSCHTGGKEKLPEYEQYRAYYKCSTLPKELTAKFGPLSCDLCNVQMGSSLTTKLHYNGKPHEKKVKAFLADWSEKTGQSIPPIPKSVQSSYLLEQKYCEICAIPLDSVADAETHFAGRNHMKNLAKKSRNSTSGIPSKKAKLATEDPTGRFDIGVSSLDGAASSQPNVGRIKKPDLYCEICNVQSSDRNVLQEHLSGARHRKALKAQSAPITKPDLYCEICNVQSTDRNVLQEHLSGARHRKALKAQSASVPVNPSESILASVIKPTEKQKEATDYSMDRTPSDHFCCQPCNMTMDSEEQFSAHEDSRKHKFNCLKLQLSKAAKRKLQL